MKSAVRKLVFNKRLLLGFEILAVDSTYARSKKNLRIPHRASFYAIIWFQSGNPVHIVDFNPVPVIPDSFLFIRKDAVQFFDQSHDFTSSVLLFTDDFFCTSEGDHHLLHTIPLFNNFQGEEAGIHMASTALMKELWALMEEEAKQPSDNFQAMLLKNYVYNFLLLAEREHQKSDYTPMPPGPHVDLLIGFKRQLESDFKKEKEVGYYADRLFVSEKVLTHALQKAIGKTPKQLIDQRVMLEAKRLLVHEYASAKTIALSLGFDEPTNFNKFFKKHSGKTPSEFRTAYTQNNMGAKVSS